MSQPGSVVEGVDIDAVVAAVRACPAVDDLAAGLVGSAITYLPGRQVGGIRLEGSRITVEVRLRWGVPVPELATQVRAAVEPLVAGRAIDIVVADVAVPQADDSETRPAATNAVPASPRIDPRSQDESRL